MYKMILVDDEDEVRGRISSKISEESGFTIVGTAGNGYDALELIEKHNPHVVLSDIKMPFIDGIELATIIKRDFPTIRIAFITGYDEFDYAREAIELKVSGYLTKPLTQNDISHFLKKLKVDLDREFQEKYNLEILKQRYEESIPLVIDNYFSSCLVSSHTGRSEEIENLRQYGISLDDKPYLLSYIKIEKREGSRDIVEYEKLKLSVRSVIKSILERHEYEHYSFMFAEGIIFLVKEKGKFFLRDVDSVFFEMVKMSEKFLDVQINIGISVLHREFSQLYTAWEEADKAIGYSHFLHSGRIVYINQLEKRKLKVLTLGEGDIKEIEHSVKFGSESELRNVVESLKLNALRDSRTIANFRPYIINMMNLIVNFAESIEADLDEVIGQDILEQMLGFSSLEQLFDWFLVTLLKLREKNLSTKMSNSQKLLDKAVQFIHGNYDDPKISMETVCDELGISISYMSLLFKKHKETTFVKYLTGVRIDRAKELLKLTGDRIVEIASKCGFSDVYYFSHCFKKYMGVSPKKYREETAD
ncbi:response regulator transcription factor [Spirochaeta isovalerica]|uniref:Two-component system response regulator YesN n=1 Tax=Spirochaeta isovalerica TaxID=150 RepID=A0A841R846_9SPIO|nr:response regulator [Spirochaeta isovalerica]MBB6481454.1 two-component system response regulator YesN [Spirochaeta isovalerica]